jgi:hypothetical protein
MPSYIVILGAESLGDLGIHADVRTLMIYAYGLNHNASAVSLYRMEANELLLLLRLRGIWLGGGSIPTSCESISVRVYYDDADAQFRLYLGIERGSSLSATAPSLGDDVVPLYPTEYGVSIPISVISMRQWSFLEAARYGGSVRGTHVMEHSVALEFVDWLFYKKYLNAAACLDIFNSIRDIGVLSIVAVTNHHTDALEISLWGRGRTRDTTAPIRKPPATLPTLSKRRMNASKLPLPTT